MAARLRVVVRPRAKRNELQVEPDGTWSVRIAAPPVDGKANRELVAYLAQLLGCPPSSIRVITGASGRHKTVEVEGMTLDQVSAIVRARPDNRRL